MVMTFRFWNDVSGRVNRMLNFLLPVPTGKQAKMLHLDRMKIDEAGLFISRNINDCISYDQCQAWRKIMNNFKRMHPDTDVMRAWIMRLNAELLIMENRILSGKKLNLLKHKYMVLPDFVRHITNEEGVCLQHWAAEMIERMPKDEWEQLINDIKKAVGQK